MDDISPRLLLQRSGQNERTHGLTATRIKKGKPGDIQEEKVSSLSRLGSMSTAATAATATTSSAEPVMDPYVYVYSGKDARHEEKAKKEEILALPLERPCAGCRRPFDSVQCCQACKCVWYCSKECQRKHWKEHRKECAVWRVPEFRMSRMLAKLVRTNMPIFDDFRRTLGVHITFWVTRASHVTYSRLESVFYRKLNGLLDQYQAIWPGTMYLNKQLRSLRRTPAGVEGPVYREKIEERWRLVEGQLTDPEVPTDADDAIELLKKKGGDADWSERTDDLFSIRFEPLHEQPVQYDNRTRIFIRSDVHPYTIVISYLVVPHECTEKGCIRSPFERHLRTDLYDATGLRHLMRPCTQRT